MIFKRELGIYFYIQKFFFIAIVYNKVFNVHRNSALIGNQQVAFVSIGFHVIFMKPFKQVVSTCLQFVDHFIQAKTIAVGRLVIYMACDISVSIIIKDIANIDIKKERA